MIFQYFILDGRRILQGENVQYDSFIMSQRGQNFDAVYNEILNNPAHAIVIIEEDEE